MIKKVDQRNKRMIRQKKQRQQLLSTMQQWNSTPIYPSGAPYMKAVDLHGKYRYFLHYSFHHSIFPKPANSALQKIKHYRRDNRNKRLEALKLNKYDASCVFIGMEDEGETYCVDANNNIADVGHCC